MKVQDLANDATNKAQKLSELELAAKKDKTVEERASSKIAIKSAKKALNDAIERCFNTARDLLAFATNEELDELERVTAELEAVDALGILAGAPALPEKRRESVIIAVRAGADWPTVKLIITAPRLSREDTIVLPPGRFEGLSRGRGWARMGKGSSAVWGEKASGGYRVGPGKWVIGSNDGFNRKDEVAWDVEHLKVGNETWTRGA